MRSGCRTATRTEKSRSSRRWTTRWPRKPVPPKKVTFPCAIVLFLAMLSDAILAGAAEIRKKRVARMRGYPQWRWHLDEAFVKVNGKLCYLWRAVDHEGEVLEAVVTAKRDKAAALKFLKRIMKTYGRPQKIVTDGLCSYSAAMKEIGNADRQEVGRRLNNRAENSHQPFRRRERAMQRFRSTKTLQKFSSVHAQVHNHFNQERHLVTRQVYKQRRSAALAEWRALAA